LTGDKAFETAKSAIERATTEKWLLSQVDNIEMSTLYTKSQKTQLLNLISARIDELNSK